MLELLSHDPYYLVPTRTSHSFAGYENHIVSIPRPTKLMGNIPHHTLAAVTKRRRPGLLARDKGHTAGYACRKRDNCHQIRRRALTLSEQALYILF